MNQKLKDVLGVVAAIAILAVGYAAVQYVGVYNKSIPTSSLRSFTVSGQGKASATPDVAEFSFQVVTQGGTDIASTQTKNTNSMNGAIAFVKTAGVADKDITTEGYSIDPRYQTYSCPSAPIVYSGVAVSVSSAQSSCPPASIVGYTVTQTVDVKVRDFTKIGDIMSGIVKNGANQVGSLSFAIDDPTTLQNQARSQAIQKAETQAQELAKEGGFTLGRLLSIQENNNYYAPVAYAGVGMKLADVASAPTIQAGSQDVNETVTLQYEIQ